jgi:CRP-like cAMP-binding protein
MDDNFLTPIKYRVQKYLIATPGTFASPNRPGARIMVTQNESAADNGFDCRAFMAKYGGVTVSNFQANDVIYAQGDRADALFYIVSGSVKVAILSDQGKEAVIALLGPGDFFGEGGLNGRPDRTSSVIVTSLSEICRLNLDAIKRALAADPEFSKRFFKFILQRNEKLKADLIAQLFNSSEKRLARILLTLANPRPDEQSSVIPLPITQEMLAQMVGTTRARINQFMRKFRELGYIEYDGAIRVRDSLQNVILEDTHNAK